MTNSNKIILRVVLYSLMTILGAILLWCFTWARGERGLFLGVSLFFTLDLFGILTLCLGDVFGINKTEPKVDNSKPTVGIRYDITRQQQKLMAGTSVLSVFLYGLVVVIL